MFWGGSQADSGLGEDFGLRVEAARLFAVLGCLGFSVQGFGLRMFGV